MVCMCACACVYERERARERERERERENEREREKMQTRVCHQDKEVQDKQHLLHAVIVRIACKTNGSPRWAH